MNEAGGDKRGQPRAPIELKVEYKKLNAFFFDYTRNISKGGTFIRTTRPLSVGTEFVFKLVVAKLDEPLTLRGRVKWVVTEEQAADDSTNPEAGMGIEFVHDIEGQRERVDAIVERLMVGELGERVYAKLMGKA
jgi:type IV pilus assembly protein PilZ